MGWTIPGAEGMTVQDRFVSYDAIEIITLEKDKSGRPFTRAEDKLTRVKEPRN